LIERRSSTKDQVVAILQLREEQAMLASDLFPLAFGEEGSEAGQPLLATGQEVAALKESASSWSLLGLLHFRKACESNYEPFRRKLVLDIRIN
jgi:hypothetical protein